MSLNPRTRKPDKFDNVKPGKPKRGKPGNAGKHVKLTRKTRKSRSSRGDNAKSAKAPNSQKAPKAQHVKLPRIRTQPMSIHHAAIVHSGRASQSMSLTDLQFMARAKGIPFGGLNKDILVRKINAY